MVGRLRGYTCCKSERNDFCHDLCVFDMILGAYLIETDLIGTFAIRSKATYAYSMRVATLKLLLFRIFLSLFELRLPKLYISHWLKRFPLFRGCSLELINQNCLTCFDAIEN
ncbi:hypothetical protein CK203_061530 [Vitis vinifera]|uniref:Uncharacterized protein n=1 Tax=Vitis vinifera TaxID=29760 RepID=A0A438GTC7_VITVI|nr:hypothetical protein CK203_061530 [Vitis vinifera]